MTQALYTHMNNKTIKKEKCFYYIMETTVWISMCNMGLMIKTYCADILSFLSCYCLHRTYLGSQMIHTAGMRHKRMIHAAFSWLGKIVTRYESRKWEWSHKCCKMSSLVNLCVLNTGILCGFFFCKIFPSLKIFPNKCLKWKKDMLQQ
jgi:hypothetical protein